MFPFLAKNENLKWPLFLGRGKFFLNRQEYIPLIPCGSKISTKSPTVKEIEAILRFSIFGKNLKIHNGRHFWGGENLEYIPLIPCGSKISMKSLYLARLGDTSNFVFFHFWQKIEKSKWQPFLGRGKFFENCQEYIAEIPCGSKISTKSL